MIKLITYADGRMSISANNCLRSGQDIGFADKVELYHPGSLSKEFIKKMSAVLAHERGAGFYCWKPYCIQQATNGMNDGDYLVWSDAGTTWLEPISKLIECMGQDIMFFTNGFKHFEWCKMDCLINMIQAFGVTSFNQLDNRCQVQASHIIFKINADTRTFIDQWLWWSMQPGMIDNEESIVMNYPTFREHRWDQAILTNLQIAYGYKLHWFPSTMFMNDQWRRLPGDSYPAMFDHHRKRNDQW